MPKKMSPSTQLCVVFRRLPSPPMTSGGGDLAVLLMVGLRRCGISRSPRAAPRRAGGRFATVAGRPLATLEQGCKRGCGPYIWRSSVDVPGVWVVVRDGAVGFRSRTAMRRRRIWPEKNKQGRKNIESGQCKSSIRDIDGSQSVLCVETGAPQPAGLGRSCGPSEVGPGFRPGCRRRLGAVPPEGGAECGGWSGSGGEKGLPQKCPCIGRWFGQILWIPR